MTDWSIEQARQTYNVAHWSEGYFDIDTAGQVLARPRPQQANSINLSRLVEDIKELHLNLPVLVRFIDILHDRVDTLCNSFAEAMRENDYRGGYTAIYPIKVNQQHSVVQEIVEHGAARVGLEAGSKPELMAVLGAARPGSMIVCNGYKDREYIRLALIGQQLGHQVYIVIEKRSELELVLAQAADLGITPCLGVRMRLASIGAGKWQNTGGEKSKFGLSAAQVLWVIARLREAGMLDALRMLHFHIGSQLVNIRDIQRGMQECARFYAELHRMDVVIDTVDVGGGLGIDYEGTRSRNPCSINYSVQEYASNIVRALLDVCTAHNLPQPHILSESGRALTAHHAMLITNIIDSEQVPDSFDLTEPDEANPRVMHDLWEAYERLQKSGSSNLAVEVWHDTVHWLQEAQNLFNQGLLTLNQRAEIEAVNFAICRRVQALLVNSQRSHYEILERVNEKLADKYFVNFSLFQSIPDVWAIDQIFPVMPLQRLNEQPVRRVVLEDITCDSDGRIDDYVDSEGLETSLPLHSIKPEEEYLLGIFLVGAYQEILGDMHNLFGDTDSINVVLRKDGSYQYSQPQQGDTVDNVLRYVHFNPDELLEQYRAKLERASLNEAQQQQYLNELSAGLHGYTYLED
ncbi:MAG: biosynthetic arginine decarboxylase [Gammaproteobacteria bacterium]|nr:biosynthetic arginine decarboxylase [Gammaproteobacteria bacterium]